MPRRATLRSAINLAIADAIVFAVATVLLASPPVEKLRGAWVTAWAPGHRTPEELDATIQAAKQAGMNALFIQVRKVADAYYRSDIEPTGDAIASGYDPLAAAIEKAHAKDIEVHAWFNCLRVWREKNPPLDPRHIVNRHPEWLNKCCNGATRVSEGMYLDPGIPEVREYIASVAEEIARKYAIDGIHLDYIRYPGPEWGYSEAALSCYRADTGAKGVPAPNDTRWLAWRRIQVTKLVELIRKRVRAARPSAKLTAATICWSDCPSDFRSSLAYSKTLQDWKLWLSRGLLDANVPMNYKSESTSSGARAFRKWLVGFTKWSSGRPVYVGIDADSNSVHNVVKQVAAVQKSGLAGFVIFPFNESPKRGSLAKLLPHMRE